MFKGQPKGLFALALANTGERFGYYTMLAIFMLFLQAKFGFEQAAASQIYAIFLAAVYFMPVVGGWLADKIGFGKCVVTGICVMFAGYICLSIPTAANGLGLTLMFGALTLIAIGTGLFKGNLQVLVGNLYDDPKYAAKRDSAFSLFYMAINIGAMFAPSAATAITNRFLGKAGLIYKADIPALAHQFMNSTITPENTEKLQGLMAQMPGEQIASMDLAAFCPYYIEHLSSSYNMGFAVAVVSLVVSIAIYLGCRSWFKHADVNAKQAKSAEGAPAAPTDFVYGDYDPKTRTLEMAWTDVADNETGYKVQYSVDDGATWCFAGSYDANVTSRTATSVKPGNTYVFRVAAYNDAGNSTWLVSSPYDVSDSNYVPAAPTDSARNPSSPPVSRSVPASSP